MSALDFLTDRAAPVTTAVPSDAGVPREARELLALIPRGRQVMVEFCGVLSAWPGSFFANFAGYWIGLGQGSIVMDGAAIVVTTPAGVHRLALQPQDDSGPADGGDQAPPARACTNRARALFFPRLKQGGTYAAHCAQD